MGWSCASVGFSVVTERACLGTLEVPMLARHDFLVVGIFSARVSQVVVDEEAKVR